MAEPDSEKSIIIEDEDLEDGEIEDDDTEDCIVVEVIKPAEIIKSDDKDEHKKKSSSSDKKSSSSSLNRKEKGKDNEEDDFMSNIEQMIAEGLKKSGIEPPMPNVKKQMEPDSAQDRRTSRNSRKRKNRRDRKEQKRENSSKKRSRVNESDGLYMVGGSPDQSCSESDGGESHDDDSYDSEEYHRMSYEERRNRRRAANKDRERDRDRRDRDRDRDRGRDHDRKEKRNRENEKEVCLRFAEFGHCNDDDCTRVHEVRQPKKMELCKFWLMECCAKKDKCSYMHGDFPCKYYYLGLKCIQKDCKFLHGKPLSENLKAVLLKHLDTAPKEILGDFPRLGRESSTKLIAQTHVKLCQEFNIPLPETEKEKVKIPSLLDMNLKPPDGRSERKSLKNNSRWLQKERECSPDLIQKASKVEGPGDVQLANLGILSEQQISAMSAIGVITVNHINNLTVAQLNDLGLSLATIGEIQATAMNINNQKCSPNQTESTNKIEEVTEKENSSAQSSTSHAVADVDLRESSQQQNISQNMDVDMRVLPTVEPHKESLNSPDTIMSPNQSDADEMYKKPVTPLQRPCSSGSTIMSPPRGIDYSQYLKDSNLNNDDENEDEPGLRIDESYCTSDYELEDKKDSQSEDDQEDQAAVPKFNMPLLPPSFNTSDFLKSSPVTKIDISSSVSQLMESKISKSPLRDPRMRDQRAQDSPSPSTSTSLSKDSQNITEISSPSYRDPRQKSKEPPQQRLSIYEIESPSEDEDLVKIGGDKDMRRLPSFLRDPENGDVDLRMPFMNMSNYVPATEIDASFGTHIFKKYEVKVVDVPKPDYSEIRRSFRQTETTHDPRLKKLCGIVDLNEPASPPKISTSTTSLPLDPRKRKQKQESSNDDILGQPKKLQISTILQNSKNYNDLSSSQKMVVNEVLAELSKQLKLFHADSSPNKIFDSSFITQRPKLQQILIGLGVFINAEGDFEELKDMPLMTIPSIHQMPPMIPNLPPPNLISLNQPPPSLFSNTMRPSLLGLAPNLPFGNFEQQDLNAQLMSQGLPFGGNDQQFNNNREFVVNVSIKMDNTIVQAEFPFKGSNNDELCFKKGDLIVWEGTAVETGKTGWFPSNYVLEYKAPAPPTETIRTVEEIQTFRKVVYNDLLESEKAHCAELRGLLENFLEPLESSKILTSDEYAQLMCNFVEVVNLHEELLNDLEESNDRIGKLFLSKAPTMKRIHHTYCIMHPKAIVIVDKHKEDLNGFMEKQGAAKPGILVLTTGLSKCFRRLDKYSAILQELERHMESGHPDRGDTQRSIAVFKDIASSSSAIRRQKELELQILTGPIRGWEGEELSTMGEIIHMGSVAVGKEYQDRYFILLHQNLLILSVSQRMSAFKFEGKIPITGINAMRLPDTDTIKNAFEITGPLIDKILAICQSSNEANKWVDLLGKSNHGSGAIDIKRNTSFTSGCGIHLQSNMSPPTHLGSNNWTISNLRPRRIHYVHALLTHPTVNQAHNSNMNYQQRKRNQHMKKMLSFCALSKLDGDDGTTPTLRQLFMAMRQMQFDIQDMKSQLNQERTLRGDLQRLIMTHMEKCGMGS
ncbi:CLUMA_CG014472, isoform B [Clunio marinus]|uniref:CLUMA_CG014472, isoform B n=1 Tax=Clunio marinus TaxID=568069 RepID=A0A1J1INC9_9DIPT|nr:CLUMA_CG014472, isoform B [Clunio marinus]